MLSPRSKWLVALQGLILIEHRVSCLQLGLDPFRSATLWEWCKDSYIDVAEIIHHSDSHSSQKFALIDGFRPCCRVPREISIMVLRWHGAWHHRTEFRSRPSELWRPKVCQEDCNLRSRIAWSSPCKTHRGCQLRSGHRLPQSWGSRVGKIRDRLWPRVYRRGMQTWRYHYPCSTSICAQESHHCSRGARSKQDCDRLLQPETTQEPHNYLRQRSCNDGYQAGTLWKLSMTQARTSWAEAILVFPTSNCAFAGITTKRRRTFVFCSRALGRHPGMYLISPNLVSLRITTHRMLNSPRRIDSWMLRLCAPVYYLSITARVDALNLNKFSILSSALKCFYISLSPPLSNFILLLHWKCASLAKHFVKRNNKFSFFNSPFSSAFRNVGVLRNASALEALPFKSFCECKATSIIAIPDIRRHVLTIVVLESRYVS